MADMYDTTTTTTTCSSPLTNNRPVLETDEISLFLHHLLHSSSSSSSSATASASASASSGVSQKLKQMPFASSSSTPFHPPLPPYSQFRHFSEDQHRQSCISTTTAATPFPNSDFRVRDRTSTAETSAGLILSSSGVYFPSDEIKDSSRLSSGVVGGSDSDALAVSDKRRKFPAENDLDDYDCESEEGMEASEEPSKQVPSRSSSKRSRAAEVHNLSEKRRRSRINEKMKALQNLIPNSNKTDKASMLDEAIEYLKQLQLQVQMLSMRNGLSLHPMYLPGVLQPLQLPQMQMGLREGTPPHMNVGTGALPVNQECAARTSFGLSSQSANLHQPMAIQNLASLTHPNTTFGLDSSFPVHQTRFQLSSEEMYRERVLPPQGPHKLHISPMARNSSEGTTHIDARSSVLENTVHVETRLLQRNGSLNMLPEDVNSNQNLIQQLQSLQTGMNAGNNDGKIKPREFQS